MKQAIQKLISELDLQEHPEGGYFRETYRSEGSIPEEALPDEFEGARNYCTGIYFLLTSDHFSAFHRIKQDEMWHFYQGLPLTIHMISPDGEYKSQNLGLNYELGQVPQYTVPKGYWFAAEVSLPDSYTLAGCTVSPGFDFKDFELADRKSLLELFPDHSEVITNFTRS